MTRIQTVQRLFWTIRYLQPKQIWYRSRRTVRKRIWRLRRQTAPQPSNGQLHRLIPLYLGMAELDFAGPWLPEVQAYCATAQNVAQGNFSFLQSTVAMKDGPRWHDPALSQLWRYHLHYFHYVVPLLVWAKRSEPTTAFQCFCQLAQDWISHNRKLAGDGWHPYTISLRLVNWLHGIESFRPQFASQAQVYPQLVQSLYGQAQFLYADLELDVRGNHLLENLRALIWAGVAFANPEAAVWLNTAMALLKVEVAEQVLADGGHFERTPTYHLVVLRDLLEIAIWLRRNRHEVFSWLDEAIRRMLDYLMVILPPDGNVPLLKDSAWDAALSPYDLLATGACYFDEPRYKVTDHFGLYPYLLFGQPGWNIYRAWAINSTDVAGDTSRLLADSGYYVLRDDAQQDYLIFDVGKPCPDYLPAHAHADLLSYELIAAGQRVIVDSGIYEYQAGEWRNYFRSTRAHNTVEVENQDQSEVWSSFRVARRAAPRLCYWQSDQNGGLIQASHNGYQRLATPTTHRRTMHWQKNAYWLVIDELLGTGISNAASYIHLEPSLTLSIVDDCTWQISGTTTSLWLSCFGCSQATVVSGQHEPFKQGWYSSTFGTIQANQVLRLEPAGQLPLIFGYVITKREPAQVQLQAIEHGTQVNLSYGEQLNVLQVFKPTQPQLCARTP